MKPEFKFQDGKAIVKLDLSAGVDKDRDGKMSIKLSAPIELEVNGLELADEMLKDTSIGKYIREKLGVQI